VLDDHPVLKDRLTALGVFSGIAIGAVAGFDMVISGGLDFITPGSEIRQVAPSAYVRVVDQPWATQTRFIPLSSNEPLFAGGAYAAEAPERLAGGMDEAAAPHGSYAEAPSEDELYAQIEALYQRQDARNYYVATASDDEPYQYYVDEPDDQSEKAPEKAELSAYETASPW